MHLKIFCLKNINRVVTFLKTQGLPRLLRSHTRIDQEGTGCFFQMLSVYSVLPVCSGRTDASQITEVPGREGHTPSSEADTDNRARVDTQEPPPGHTSEFKVASSRFGQNRQTGFGTCYKTVKLFSVTNLLLLAFVTFKIDFQGQEGYVRQCVSETGKALYIKYKDSSRRHYEKKKTALVLQGLAQLS